MGFNKPLTIYKLKMHMVSHIVISAIFFIMEDGDEELASRNA